MSHFTACTTLLQSTYIMSMSVSIFNVARIAVAYYYEVHEGAVESQNYVRKRLTKKECFKTLADDGQRRV